VQRVYALNRYPILSEEIAKSDTPLRNVDEILARLRDRVTGDRGTEYLGIFDHYGHSVRLGGRIHPEVQDAKEIMFCFGPALPDVELLALRPRAIGVADLGNRFVISFLEAPSEETNQSLARWIEELRAPGNLSDMTQR